MEMNDQFAAFAGEAIRHLDAASYEFKDHNFEGAIRQYCHVLREPTHLARSAIVSLSLARRRLRLQVAQQASLGRIGIVNLGPGQATTERITALLEAYPTGTDTTVIHDCQGVEMSTSSMHFHRLSSASFGTDLMTFVSRERFDILHLAGITPANVILAVAYKAVWGSDVLVDLHRFDDLQRAARLNHIPYLEFEACFPNPNTPDDIRWNSFSLALSRHFDGFTVSQRSSLTRIDSLVIPTITAPISEGAFRHLVADNQKVGPPLTKFIKQLRAAPTPAQEGTYFDVLVQTDARFLGLSLDALKSSPTVAGTSAGAIPELLRTRATRRLIADSGLFDLDYYRQQVNEDFTFDEAIDHFVSVGARDGLRPFIGFEVDSYAQLNADLALSDPFELVIHYIRVGRSEKRYCNRLTLQSDALEIRHAGVLNHDHYSAHACADDLKLSLEEHYLAIGWREGVTPNEVFDADFYMKCHHDAAADLAPPLLHYIRNPGRIMCELEIEEFVAPLVATGEFDEEFYLQEYANEIPDGIPPLVHYACRYRSKRYDPNPHFSTEYYLRKYEDIANGFMNPLVHYVSHGRQEGRAAGREFAAYMEQGSVKFDFNKPTVVVVCHEASRSGAPILGLQLIDAFSAAANVIAWLGKGGPLREDFLGRTVCLIEGCNTEIDAEFMTRELLHHYPVQVAVVNSAATSRIALGLHAQRIPIVALVHEYADYMASEVIEIALSANRIVFPAADVKRSADAICMKSLSGVPTNTTVMHQGQCVAPSGNDGFSYERGSILARLGVQVEGNIPDIVLGCGYVQMRKGVEYFIQAAELIKRRARGPVKFIWVGGGYRPETDFGYSVWLRSQLLRSNLENDLVFFEEAADLEPFFALASAFFLSSRLDPFPNVAIDAAMAGVPIVAFEQGTGFVDFIKQFPHTGQVVPFLDANAASVALGNYLQQDVNGDIRSRRAATPEVKAALHFGCYADYVADECVKAVRVQEQIENEALLIKLHNLMHEHFYASGIPRRTTRVEAQYEYVDRWSRGVPTVKGRIGFNDRRIQPQAEIVSPLMAQFTEGATAPTTHSVFWVEPWGVPERIDFAGLRIAVHIHAHYVEQVGALLSRFDAVAGDLDFVLTTDTEAKSAEIEAITKTTSAQIGKPIRARVIVVPNRGRDVGPFIMIARDVLHDYDIIGHFHIKGTKQLHEQTVKQWQEFLFDTLIGSRGQIAAQIIAKLISKTDTGLFFQEDPCLPSWGENFEHANALIARLNLPIKLSGELEYPTGNMFWVRRKALAPLIDRPWEWNDFPGEPVPYDGTMLHAIERLTPLICCAEGYRWSTVHNPTAFRYY